MGQFISGYQTVNMNIKLVTILLSYIAGCYGGLLGAGQGGGSCAAAPFRTPASSLQWPNGCPAGNECCTEFGYCHPQSAWLAKAFRDCNGVSNGSPYPIDVIQAESAAAAQGDTRGAALLAAAGQGAAAAAAPAIGYGAASNIASGVTGYGSGAAGFGASGNAAGGYGASGAGAGGYGASGAGAGGYGASGVGAGGYGASGFGASGFGASGNVAGGFGAGSAGYGLAGSGAAGQVAGFGGAGFVSFPNGAIVPAEPADVAAARSEHLKAHSFA